MDKITICAECKHAKLVDNVFLEYHCDAPWPQETDLITGRKTTPLANWGCNQNDGQCREYRNKETGLPVAKPWCERHPGVTVLSMLGITLAGFIGCYAFGYYCVFPIWRYFQ